MSLKYPVFYIHSFLEEPVNLRFRLTVINFSKIFEAELLLNYLGVGDLAIGQYAGEYWISHLVENPLDKCYTQGGLKEFLYNYKQTILAQYLILQGAACFPKSKRRNDKAVNSLQDTKERILHVHMLVESFCIVVQKYVYDNVAIVVKLDLSLFLIFHQISGLFYYKIVLIKRMESKVLYGHCPYLHGVSFQEHHRRNNETYQYFQ